MTLSAPELQRRLREYAEPRFGYRLGEDGIEKSVFDGELPDGWVDSPARVGAAPEAQPVEPEGEVDIDTAEVEPAVEAVPETDSAALSPPYNQYGFADLRDEYKRRVGEGVKFGTSTEDLVKALDDLDA